MDSYVQGKEPEPGYGRIRPGRGADSLADSLAQININGGTIDHNKYYSSYLNRAPSPAHSGSSRESDSARPLYENLDYYAGRVQAPAYYHPQRESSHYRKAQPQVPTKSKREGPPLYENLQEVRRQRPPSAEQRQMAVALTTPPSTYLPPPYPGLARVPQAQTVRECCAPRPQVETAHSQQRQLRPQHPPSPPQPPPQSPPPPPPQSHSPTPSAKIKPVQGKTPLLPYNVTPPRPMTSRGCNLSEALTEMPSTYLLPPYSCLTRLPVLHPGNTLLFTIRNDPFSMDSKPLPKSVLSSSLT
ncbi:hypothetical protein AAG570_001527 [Ranatra chinensis]|uniref:Uncharacterized protein n=1 Tax=Ranatra chinensis TaxID=642074 RepID=A0ABD0YAR0_9HEMI